MTRIFEGGQPIAVTCDANGKPMRFTWRGHVNKIDRILETWEVHTDWWDSEGEVHRTNWAVLTAEGVLCVIIADHLAGGAWHLLRVYD